MDTLTLTRPDDWHLPMFLGTLYLMNGDHAKAVEAHLRALKLAQKPADQAEIQGELGMAYYNLGDYAKAEKAYLAVLAATPNDLAALNNLAYLYVENLKQADKALPHAERAVKNRPGDGNVLDTYGWTLANLGQTDKAEQALLQAVQAGPPSAEFRYHLGWVYERLGRPEDALRHYENGLTLAPKDQPVYQKLKTAVDQLRARQAPGGEKK